MVYLLLIGGFFIALGVTLVFTPYLRTLAIRRDWVDHPHDERKRHSDAIPTIGGIAIVAGFAASLLFFAGMQLLLPVSIAMPSGMLVLGGALLAATGLYDDVHGLGFKRKFVIQLIVAYLMLWAGYRIDLSVLSFIELTPYQQSLFSIPLTLVWIVGLINAVNMIDGLDGLAAGVTGIAFVSLAVVFGLNGDWGAILVAVAIVGALIGFLVFNYSPASIFMGDTGSMFLGFMLALYSLEGTGHSDPLLALVIPVVALGLPVVDAMLAVIRRPIAGKSPFLPDRDHIHHRVEQYFRSQHRAVLVLYGVGGVFGISAILLVGVDLATGMIILGLMAAVVLVLLRRLGYLRVRQSVRTMQRRYYAWYERKGFQKLAQDRRTSRKTPRGHGAKRHLEEEAVNVES